MGESILRNNAHLYATSLALAALLAASCASGKTDPLAPGASKASAPGGQGAVISTGVKPGSGADTPVAAKAARVVRLFRNPGIGEQEKIAKYWDYGRDAPFQVSTFTANGMAADPGKGKGYATHVSTSASVSLIDMPKHKLRLLQAGETSGVEAGASDAATLTDDAPQVDDAVIESGQIDGDHPDPTAVAANLFADAESPAEAGDDPSFPTVAEGQADLSTPHEVVSEEDSPFLMSNENEEVTFTDKVTGNSLHVSFDLGGWQHFIFTNDKGTGTLELNPDNSFLVDGKGAAHVKDAVVLLKASPVFADISHYIVAMMVARVARTSPVSSRNGMNYHVLNMRDDDQARAYILMDAFLKDLLRGAATR